MGIPYTDCMTVQRGNSTGGECVIITDVRPLSRVSYMQAQRKARSLRHKLFPLLHPWLAFVYWAIDRY